MVWGGGAGADVVAGRGDGGAIRGRHHTLFRVVGGAWTGRVFVIGYGVIILMGAGAALLA